MPIKKIILKTFLFIFLLFCQNIEASVYALRNDLPTGSSRVIGLGGALTANANDISSIYTNPAGIALNKFKLEASSTTNPVEDKETKGYDTDFQYAAAPTLKSYKASMYAAAFQKGRTTIAASASYPIDWEYVYADLLYKITLSSKDFLIAYAPTDKLAIGFLARSYTVYQKYSTTYWDSNLGQYTNKAVEDENSVSSYNAGLSWKTDKFGIGVSYTPPLEIPLKDSNANANIVGMYNNPTTDTPFKNVFIPQKTVLGIYALVNDKITLYLDNETIGVVKDGVVIGTGITQYNEQTYIPIPQQITRFGLEVKLVNQSKREAYWRIGTYKEGQKTSNDVERPHTTMGLDIRFGPVRVAISYDQAENFSSSAQGIGIVYDAL